MYVTDCETTGLRLKDLELDGGVGFLLQTLLSSNSKYSRWVVLIMNYTPGDLQQWL